MQVTDTMSACRSIDDIVRVARLASELDGPTSVAVASSGEAHVIKAVAEATAAGLVRPCFFGDETVTRELSEEHGLESRDYELHHTSSQLEAATLAVKATSQHRCEVLMKGYIRTSTLMREVLHRDYGLRSGRKFSHVLVFEAPHFDRLFLMSDGALNIEPDLSLKIEIVKNAVIVARQLGIDNPKVALIAAIETVDIAQRTSIDNAIIAKMADRGQIKEAIVDGPLALDNAVSPEAANIKKIKSEVAGDADILIVDNIDVGNVFYKALVFFAKARVAGVVTGATAPIVLTSRADSAETKFNSLALGCALAARRKAVT